MDLSKRRGAHREVRLIAGRRRQACLAGGSAVRLTATFFTLSLPLSHAREQRAAIAHGMLAQKEHMTAMASATTLQSWLCGEPTPLRRKRRRPGRLLGPALEYGDPWKTSGLAYELPSLPAGRTCGFEDWVLKGLRLSAESLRGIESRW